MNFYDLRGLLVVSPVDVWLQLSPILSLDDVVAVGDALVRRVDPLASIEQLHDATRRHHGRRGARMLRRAASSVRSGTDSRRETKLRLVLIRAGLPEPEVNGPIVDEYGGFVALGDLVYRPYRVLVEYDGGVHREDERQYHRDIDRLDDVMDIGWRVVRINKTHMRASGAVAVRKVGKALLDAGWQP